MEELCPPERLLEDATRFGRHPAFPDAVKVYCVALARLREAPRFLNALIATDVRWRIMGYLLYLESDRDRFGPHGGATYGRLLEICTRRAEASPRELKTLLGLLKIGFLVRVVRDERDRRIGYYQHTGRLDAFVEQWLGYAVAALDLLEPEMRRSRFVDDPAFVTRFHVSGGRAHLAGTVPLADRVPRPMSSMKSMLGSYAVIAGIMEAELHDRPSPPVASLSRRFGLSRAQVRNVLAAGQQLDVFTLDEAGAVRATPALRNSFARWISIELAFYARHMRAPGEPVGPVRDELA